MINKYKATYDRLQLLCDAPTELEARDFAQKQWGITDHNAPKLISHYLKRTCQKQLGRSHPTTLLPRRR